jgi:4-hydroxy-3-methylbut-2-enyl diphosphate reductase
MIVLRAAELGMCFGVRDALAALDAVQAPAEVTIHGELVHNPEVQRRLDARGFRRSPEADRPVPATPSVLVTAHGISERERGRLLAAGRRLIDTTCPLVHKAHAAARELAAEGRRIVVLGQPGHVEVQGVVEDHDGAIVVAGAADVRDFGAPRLGVLCQTTLPEASGRELFAAIAQANPAADLRFVDTVCSPTKARQQALAELLQRVDALVVVGGHHSNNTKKLAASAAAAGVPALHVENEDSIDRAWLRPHRVVGLTAGTSTLPATVDAVERRLRAFAAAR